MSQVGYRQSSKERVLDLLEDENHEIFKQHETESVAGEVKRASKTRRNYHNEATHCNGGNVPRM